MKPHRSNADARLAIAMFCYSVRKQVAAMIAALGGVDLLVFTGGIGENDVEARAAICGGLSWLGVRLDPARNRSVENPISESASRCAVHVMPSQEDEQTLVIPGRCSHVVFLNKGERLLITAIDRSCHDVRQKSGASLTPTLVAEPCRENTSAPCDQSPET